jgi:hypothetical protein
MPAEHRVVIKLDVKPKTAAGWLAKGRVVHASSTRPENAQTFASLRAFVAGVQVLCDAAPDPDHAIAIAAAAGLDTRLEPVHYKPAFEGKVLGNGVVHLHVKVPARRGARIFYEWQTGNDGGATWLPLPNTNDANLRVPGLTPGSTVHFRFRTTIKNAPSEWSQAIAVLVR